MGPNCMKDGPAGSDPYGPVGSDPWTERVTEMKKIKKNKK